MFHYSTICLPFLLLMSHVIYLCTILALDLMLTSVQFITKCLSGLLPKIFSSLSKTDLEILIHSLQHLALTTVIPWFAGLEAKSIGRLQLSQNSARLLTQTTPTLYPPCAETLYLKGVLYIYCNSFLYTVILWVEFFFYPSCQLSHSYRIFSELNCHIFYSDTCSNLVQSPLHHVSLIGRIWSKMLHEIRLSARQDFCFYSSTLFFSFYFASFSITNYIYYNIYSIK